MLVYKNFKVKRLLIQNYLGKQKMTQNILFYLFPNEYFGPNKLWGKKKKKLGKKDKNFWTKINWIKNLLV